MKKLNTLEGIGLGKNDFKGIANREHDPNQLSMERFAKRPKLDFADEGDDEIIEIEPTGASVDDTIVID